MTRPLIVSNFGRCQGLLHEMILVLVSCSALHNDIGSPFAVETRVSTQAIEMGMAMRIQKLEIEGDALTIIKKCKREEKDISGISAFISDIQQNLRHFQKIIFTHVPKTSNLIAYTLATESLRRNEVFYLER